jgi:hypothetical protein
LLCSSLCHGGNSWSISPIGPWPRFSRSSVLTTFMNVRILHALLKLSSMHASLVTQLQLLSLKHPIFLHICFALSFEFRPLGGLPRMHKSSHRDDHCPSDITGAPAGAKTSFVGQHPSTPTRSPNTPGLQVNDYLIARASPALARVQLFSARFFLSSLSSLHSPLSRRSIARSGVVTSTPTGILRG